MPAVADRRRLGSKGGCFAKQWFRHRGLPFKAGALRSMPGTRRDPSLGSRTRWEPEGPGRAPSRAFTEQTCGLAPLAVPERGDWHRWLGLSGVDITGELHGGVRPHVSRRLASMLDKRDQIRLTWPVRVW
jgi:hypothetical protein